MYLPSDFVVNDAVECGKLIDQAYAQYVNAVAPVSSAVPWTIQDGYNNLGIFSAVESGKMLPFGFVVSKNRRLFVVVRGTQTPLEWLDDASIQPKPARGRKIPSSQRIKISFGFLKLRLPNH